MAVTSRPPGRRDDAISLASSVGSCFLLPLTSQDNALCASLWIIPVKSLVSARSLVDERGCGNVDNRGGAQSCQVGGLRGRPLLRRDLLTLSDRHRTDLMPGPSGPVTSHRAGPPACPRTATSPARSRTLNSAPDVSGRVDQGERRRAYWVSCGISRMTSAGSLSSRRPWNRGWRSSPPVVHSLKPTWATRRGCTQCTPDRGGRPRSNGGWSCSSPASLACRRSRVCRVKPVPTLPA